jgi:hypothetical protein
LRRKLLGPLVSLAVVILLDAAVGWIFLRDGKFQRRPVPPYDISSDRRTPDPGRKPTTIFDPLLGWTLRPGAVSADGRIRINAAGARSRREYTIRKPAGVLRIAAFGDSYTFGDEVRDEETWCHQLERSRDGLEVINFGVNAYGTDQACLRFMHHAKEFEIDVVLCGFMPKDALRNVNVYRPAYSHGARAHTKPRFLLREDGALELFANPARSREHLEELRRTGALLEILLKHDYWVRRAPAAYLDSPLFASSFARMLYARYENRRDVDGLLRDANSEPFQVTLAIVEKMAGGAAARGQRFFFVVLPHPAAVDADPRPWDQLAEAVRNKGIPVIDCTDALMEIARDGALAMPGEHYTPAGNAAVARVLAARIAAN